MLNDDKQMTRCCEATYEDIETIDPVTRAVTGTQRVCSVCRKPCDLMPETLEIKVKDDINLKDIGPGQR